MNKLQDLKVLGVNLLACCMATHSIPARSKAEGQEMSKELRLIAGTRVLDTLPGE